MQIESIVKECLFEFVRVILNFEKALIKTYDLNDHPYQCQRLFPKSGVVKLADNYFTYQFHGSGCTFNYAELEVSYDYDIQEHNYIMVSPWKFWKFSIAYLEKNFRSSLTINEVAAALEQLTKAKSIEKRSPDHSEYRIDFSWFEAFKPNEPHI